ncbi:MAG TPA: methylmalonyl-CoA mutase [Chloroflexi bacterium]|jgi:methylmalonyl-CoA mutase C-terminal domain/subunit|nr:methylmalonyl-CoA mutase [Chloroflexota bacterium]
MDREADRRIRVLVAKAGLDGHQAGIRLVAHAMRDAGMEVVYLGLYNSVEQIVQAAVEEAVDVVGLSSLCGAHLNVIPKVAAQLRDSGMGDAVLIAGGVIPNKDIPALTAAGVARVFKSGTPLEEMTAYIVETVRERWKASERSAAKENQRR